MPGRYDVPVPMKTLLMKEFRFLPPVGMTDYYVTSTAGWGVLRQAQDERDRIGSG